MARTIDEFGRESGSIAERKEKKKQELAMNEGASTPVRIDTAVDGYGNTYKRVLHNFGAGRIGKIRPKKV